MWRSSYTGLVCALIGALAAGCGGSPSTPHAALDEFADALATGRYDAAYDAMSKSYRRRVTREEFECQVSQTPVEAKETARLLAKPAGDARVSATLMYADGEQVDLVYEEGGWKIANNLANFYDQSSPRSALRSFVRAVERRRYDVVLRLVPNADRTGMTENHLKRAWEREGKTEIEQLVSNLRASLDNPIEVVGDRATMAYGERFSVQFVQEDGVWRIEDPD